MTSAPHLDCTLHGHNHTHIAATHSTFLSEYPRHHISQGGSLMLLHSFICGLCAYTSGLIICNAQCTKWSSDWMKGKMRKLLVMRLLSLFCDFIFLFFFSSLCIRLFSVHLNECKKRNYNQLILMCVWLCVDLIKELAGAAGAPLVWNVEKGKIKLTKGGV